MVEGTATLGWRKGGQQVKHGPIPRDGSKNDGAMQSTHPGQPTANELHHSHLQKRGGGVEALHHHSRFINVPWLDARKLTHMMQP